MTKSRSTKSALIASILAICLCFTMLVGTTFAWFTDSVTSSSNVIMAGNLDIVVEYTLDGENWNDLDGADDLFKKGAWEPGHTEVVALRIKNNGNLALKYAANMNIVNEKIGTNKDGADIVLSEILTVGTLVQAANQVGDIAVELAFTNENMYKGTTAFKASNVLVENQELLPGEAHYVVVKVDMPETVGDEANAKDKDSVPSIEFGINVLAAQLASENDSFGKDYDADATYPGPDVWDGTSDTSWYNDTDSAFTLSTAEQLAGFAELANSGNTFPGKTIELDSSMDLNGEQWTTIKGFSGTLNGNDHTISNFSVDATADNAGFIDWFQGGTIKDLTLTDVNATVGNYRFGVLARYIEFANIVNVTVKDVNVTTTAPDAIVAGLFASGIVNTGYEVNNCTVENLTVNAEAGADLIGGITTIVQRNGDEADGTNIFENLHVKNFKVTVNDDTDGDCGVGGLVGQTQSVWQNPRFNNCTVTGLDITATGRVDVGGFICYPGSWTYAENCTAEGKIDVSGVTSADDYAGGFFGDYGWGDNVSKGDHKVTSCSADVDITTKYASAGGFVGSGTNSEGRNKNITLTNCEAKGTVTLVEGGTANIGGFAGNTDRGIYINCSAAQEPFIGKVLDGCTLNDDGNGTLTVTK